MFSPKYLLTLLVVTPFLFFTQVHGDTFVIDELSDSFNPVGEFSEVFGNNPASSPGQVEEILDMGNSGTSNSQTGIISAGLLWTLLDDEGVTSIKYLVLSLGINESGQVGSNWVDVEALRIRIEDPDNLGTFLVDIELDQPSNNLVQVFNYSQGANTAEAQFRFDLPFDFVSKFNSGSTAQIILDATVSNRSSGSEIFFFDSAVNVVPERQSALVLMIGIFYVMRPRRIPTH